jgi:putative endonuclease
MIGQRGEQLAAEYLERKGYRVLQSNFRTRYGEVDLICQDGHDLVFIEVKARTSHRLGLPEQAVTPGKLRRLRRAILFYLQEQRRRYRGLRIEVVAVDLEPGSLAAREIRHFKEIF